MSAVVEALGELLADGPLWARDATSRMLELGFSKRQTHRARLALDVVTRKRGAPGDPEAGWWWEMPDDATCPTCGRRYVEDVPQRAADVGGYRAPSPALVPDVEDRSGNTEAPSFPPPPRRYEPGPTPRCSLCGKASAEERGERCLFQTPQGVRCVGVLE